MIESNSWDVDILRINESIKYLGEYIERRKIGSYNKIEFRKVLQEIAFVMREWARKTYVGEEKTEEIKEIFQNFYVRLRWLVDLLIAEKSKLKRLEKQFIKSIVYRGKIYRYLGTNTPYNKAVLEIHFNDIYVSWSKNEKNSYFESKLSGVVKKLYCNIPENNYGFDLCRFQRFYNVTFMENCDILNPTEQEVVFPTIKELVYKICTLE